MKLKIKRDCSELIGIRQNSTYGYVFEYHKSAIASYEYSINLIK